MNAYQILAYDGNSCKNLHESKAVSISCMGRRLHAMESTRWPCCRTYYVNDANTNEDVYASVAGAVFPTHDGLSITSPVSSIQCIIDQYVLGAGVGSGGNLLTFRGNTNDPTKTVLQVGGNIIRLQGTHHIRLSHLTVRNGGVGVLFVGSDDCELEYVISRNNGSGFQHSGGSDDVSFDHCISAFNNLGFNANPVTRWTWNHGVSWGNTIAGFGLTGAADFDCRNSVIADNIAFSV